MRPFLITMVLASAARIAVAEPELHAGAERFRLRWSADNSCAREREVGAEALHLLEMSVRDVSKPPLEVDARVSRAPGGFLLTLTLDRGSVARTRFLSAPTCDELAHAAALVIALAVEPSLALERRDAPVSATAPEPAPVAPPTVDEPAPCPTVPEPQFEAHGAGPQLSMAPAAPRCRPCPVSSPPEQRTPAHGGVAISTSLTLGALPQVLPRPGVGVAYANDAHWLEAGLSGAFAALGPRSDQSGAAFQLWLFTPRYCRRTTAWPGRVGVCASIEVGASRATGLGLPATHTRWSTWAVPALGAQVAMPAGVRSELTLNADLGFTVSRTSFRLDGEEVFRPWPVLPSLRLGVLL